MNLPLRGNSSLVLHTTVSDPSNPKKLWVGILAACVFATGTDENVLVTSNIVRAGLNYHFGGL
jgi:hypothetical protein